MNKSAESLKIVCKCMVDEGLNPPHAGSGRNLNLKALSQQKHLTV